VDQIYTAEEAKRMVERGLYDTNGSFRTEAEIKRKLAINGELPVYTTKNGEPLTVNDFLIKAEERRKSFQEISPISENYLGITLPDTSALHFIGDMHLASLTTNNKRIATELEAIKNTPNHYVVFLGDLVNGVWWGGSDTSEQILTLSEQYRLLRTIFKEMKGKILFAVSGEHDSKWASKTGADPYTLMTEESGSPYVRGVAEVKIDIGEQTYKLVVQHKARGNSIYNKNHPTFREARFSLQGADLYVSAHNHQKQISQETIREFGGARMVTHIAIGPYKEGDEYSEREGFIHQGPVEMFGASALLHKDKKEIETSWSIVEAINKWADD
jgi:hypothetical protein